MKKCCEQSIQNRLETPEVVDFLEAVKIEAAHQQERWKDTDPIKEDPDWYWLIGWLGGKVLTDPHEVDDRRSKRDRQLHRIITVAAAAYNWRQAKKSEK